MKYLIKVYIGEANVDDIDHLGNRRVRSVGELLANQLKIAFSRMERIAKERMSLKETDTIKPQDLISIKAGGRGASRSSSARASSPSSWTRSTRCPSSPTSGA